MTQQQDTPTPLPERMKLIRILRLWFPSSAKESTFRQRMMLHLAVTSEEKKTLTAAEEFTWTSFAKVKIDLGSLCCQRYL